MGHVGHFELTHMFHPSRGTSLDAYTRAGIDGVHDVLGLISFFFRMGRLKHVTEIVDTAVCPYPKMDSISLV
jgi:hypothetical protein